VSTVSHRDKNFLKEFTHYYQLEKSGVGKMISQSQTQGVDPAVKEISKFLGFFAAAKIYKVIDQLAHPFSYDDVVSAINEALRQARVYIDSAIVAKITKKENSGEKTFEIKVVKVRDKYIKAPRLPDPSVIEKFFELCREDLVHAKIAASLAYAYIYPEFSEDEVKRE